MVNFKFKTLLILLLFLIATSLSAEERPVIQWSNTYGEGVARSIQQTSDGGFIVCGDTASGSFDDAKIQTIKLNSSGGTTWRKTLSWEGAYDFGNGFSVQETSDGNYIVCGHLGLRHFLAKLDSDGDSVWTAFPEDYNGYSATGHTVRQTSDGGYISVGTTWLMSGLGGGVITKIFVAKTSSQGDTLWQRNYYLAETGINEGYSILQSGDSDYIIAGYATNPDDTTIDRAVLFKIDSLSIYGWAPPVWYQCYGSSEAKIFSVIKTSDGGFITTAGKNGGDIIITKTNSSGDSLWAKTFDGSQGPFYASEEKADAGDHLIQQTTDGGFVITGQKDGDVYLFKIDSDGDTLWTGKYGDGYGRSVYCTSDGGYVIAGEQNGDFLVTKVIPSYLLLQNDTVGIGDTNNYVARDSIKAAGNSTYFVVEGNGSTGGYCTMEAGILITLKPGFQAQTGSIFSAIINTSLGLSSYKSLPGLSFPENTESEKETKETIPKVFSCAQNKPNPFTRNTTINYGLPKDSDVILTVYNLAGQAVRTLVNANQTAGFKSVMWDGKNSMGAHVPKGVYFYVFKAGDFEKHHKMILLK